MILDTLTLFPAGVVSSRGAYKDRFFFLKCVFFLCTWAVCQKQGLDQVICCPSAALSLEGIGWKERDGKEEGT